MHAARIGDYPIDSYHLVLQISVKDLLICDQRKVSDRAKAGKGLNSQARIISSFPLLIPILCAFKVNVAPHLTNRKLRRKYHEIEGKITTQWVVRSALAIQYNS